MKVVHVTAYYPPEHRFGGPPASIHELCRALQVAGVAVQVVTTTGGNQRATALEDGVPVTRSKRRSDVAFFAFIDGAIKAALADADVCHVHGLFNWPVWRAASLTVRAGRPLVISPRGMLEPAALAHHRRRKRFIWPLFDRAALGRASAIVAATPEERETVRQAGWDAVVLRNGIEVPEPLPSRGLLRARLDIPSDAPIITFVGRLHPIKRLDILAAAFKQLAVRHPTARLIVAGPDESGLQPSLAADLAGLESRVHFLGSIEAAMKWQLLVDSDTVVLCSDSESYGRVVAEALAAGVPPVVTNTCPWPVLQAEGIGRWVPQTPSAVAGAVSDLLRDPEGRAGMARRARSYALTHLTWPGITAGYVSLYESLVRSGAPHRPS